LINLNRMGQFVLVYSPLRILILWVFPPQTKLGRPKPV
jgi:hypothetical protein